MAIFKNLENMRKNMFQIGKIKKYEKNINSIIEIEFIFFKVHFLIIGKPLD